MIREIFVLLTFFVWIAIDFFEKDNIFKGDKQWRFVIAQSITCIMAVGFFLSKNILVAFGFFEVMSIASAVLVFYKETEDSVRAGKSYLTYAIAGGMVSLMGLFMYYTNDENTFISALLMLVGFAVKAGMVPLHTWLMRSYIQAPRAATILLSSVLSKCGIFGMMIVCGFVAPHNSTLGLLIMIAGCVTIFSGGIRGIFSNEAKRLLAASSMSQMGFMIMGVGAFCLLGEHGVLAAAGCVIYCVNHGLIKLVLFSLSKDYKRDKILKAIIVIAMLGIIGFPGFCGYVGKTLIHEAILECGGGVISILEILFILGGGLTTCYMIKLFKLLVLSEDSGENPPAMSFRIMLYITTIISLAIGLIPGITNYVIAECVGFFGIDHPAHHVNIFTLEAILGSVKSMGLGVIYYLLINRFAKEDVFYGKKDIEDTVYVPFFMGFLPVMLTVMARIVSLVPRSILTLLRGIMFLKRSAEFVPSLNENFGNYSKEAKVARLPRGISYSLLLLVVGITGALLYLVIMYYSSL